MARVHPRTVQQHSKLPFKVLRDPEEMVMELGGGEEDTDGDQRCLMQPPGQPGPAGQELTERSRKYSSVRRESIGTSTVVRGKGLTAT